MNAKLFLVAHPVGILCDAFCEATTEKSSPTTDQKRRPRSPIANATGRGRGADTLCFARVHPKSESFARRHYLTDDEQRDLTLWHEARYARQRVKTGRSSANDRKIAHVFGNLLQWVRLREVQHCTTMLVLGAGWWRDGSSGSKDLAELAALIRGLDRLVNGQAPEEESPFADYDPGFVAELHA